MRILSLLSLAGLLGMMMPVNSVYAGGMIAEAGELIRGTTFSAVYYMGEDGFRYVFPNEKTYKTWYADASGNADFSSVRTLSDADLATIQMGGNVTYHPGSRMIKINSDAKTYFVNQGGTLQWVSDEETAIALYGADWNKKIDDVPDGFFGNYTIGESLTTHLIPGYAGLTHDVISSISLDKDLVEYTIIPIRDMAFGDTDGLGDDNIFTISAGATVRFLNADSTKHTATADDGSWGTGTLNQDDSFVKRFDEPGTYTFYCSYHPDMTGTIIVE